MSCNYELIGTMDMYYLILIGVIVLLLLAVLACFAQVFIKEENEENDGPLDLGFWWKTGDEND